MTQSNPNERLVRVEIDRSPFESPSPTTGLALYALGNVPNDMDLFRETTGNEEDQLVPRDGTPLELRPEEHFYSAKEFHIFVNTRRDTFTKPRITFEDLVKLATGQPPAPGQLYSISYSHGPRRNHQGSIAPGGAVWIKNDMVFDVTPTVKS